MNEPVQLIPIKKIRVLNSRSRNRTKFKDITESIGAVGLKKPITVSVREEDDDYDLVCGEGRLEAYRQHGADLIPAMVVAISLEDRLLHSLVENLTKRTRTPLEAARDLAILKGRGHSNSAIAAMVGVSEAYVGQLLNLVESGEERLVTAVERGEIPISIALDIAKEDDAGLQRCLQEAYQAGDLRGRALLRARRLIDQRRARGKELDSDHRGPRPRAPTRTDLMRTLRRENQKQELLVRKARHCEQRLRFVLSALKDLLKEEEFISILMSEKLAALPKHLSDLLAT
jgi:ParB family chromosome partitioning protein